MAKKWLNKVKWDDNGLVPVIVQETGSNDVLMFAFMNRDALQRTVELGEAVFWSRSRKRVAPAGMSTATAGARTPAWTPWNGLPR